MNEQITAEEQRELEEAGAKRRAAMREREVDSYRSLRAELNRGVDKLEERSLDPRAVAALLVPEGRSVPYHQFAETARLRGLAEDPVSVRGLLARLKDCGVVRVTGSVPRCFVARPTTPKVPTFTPTEDRRAEAAHLLQLAENLRRENQELRTRLQALTGASQ